MLQRNIPGAAAIKKLKDDPHALLSAILIGSSVVTIAAASLATSIAFRIVPNHAVALSTGVTTLIILLFGELIPKSFAASHCERISLVVAKPVLLLQIILKPIIFILDKITSIFVKKVERPSVTEEDIEAAVELGKQEGFIKAAEKELIENIFKFDEINVSQIMTPRNDIFALEVSQNLKQVLPAIIKANRTRVPIYEDSLNKIVGIVNMKNLVPILKKGQNPMLKKIMYPPFFVPENKRIDSLLNAFRKRKEHMAIVIDEHGLVTGLVTLENVLEEIVGEIKDESDKLNPHVRKIGSKTWEVLGKSDIEEVNEKIKSQFKEAGDYNTISGLILGKLGRIPKEGESVEIDKYLLEVKEVEAHRIVKVKIKKK